MRAARGIFGFLPHDLSHLIIELCSCPSRLKQTSTMMRIDNVVVTSGIKLILWLRVWLARICWNTSSSFYTHRGRPKRRAMPHPLDVYWNRMNLIERCYFKKEILSGRSPTRNSFTSVAAKTTFFKRIMGLGDDSPPIIRRVPGPSEFSSNTKQRALN